MHRAPWQGRAERATEAVVVVEVDPTFCFEVAVNVDEESEDMDSSSCGLGLKNYLHPSCFILSFTKIDINKQHRVAYLIIGHLG